MAANRATPKDLMNLIKTVESAMKELDSLRSKSEIPAWEKKEIKWQRQLERAKKDWAKKKAAEGVAKKAPAVKPKPVSAKPRTRGGGMGGPLSPKNK